MCAGTKVERRLASRVYLASIVSKYRVLLKDCAYRWSYSTKLMIVHVLNTPWQAVTLKTNSKALHDFLLMSVDASRHVPLGVLTLNGVLRRGHSSSFMNESASATAVTSKIELQFVKCIFLHYYIRTVVPPIRAVHTRTLFA